MTIDDALKLAHGHIIDTLPPLAKLYLRPGSSMTDHSSLSFTFQFPTGGQASLTVGFDIEHRGAKPVPVLIPRARISSSIGAHIDEASLWADSIKGIVDSARNAVALMRQQDIET